VGCRSDDCCRHGRAAPRPAAHGQRGCGRSRADRVKRSSRQARRRTGKTVQCSRMKPNFISVLPRKCRWLFKMSRSICTRSSSRRRRRPSAWSAGRHGRRDRADSGHGRGHARPQFPPPVAQHGRLDAKLRRDVHQRAPAALRQRYRLGLELVRDGTSRLGRHQGTSLLRSLAGGVPSSKGGPDAVGRPMTDIWNIPPPSPALAWNRSA
jgi:hypothetical protein